MKPIIEVHYNNECRLRRQVRMLMVLCVFLASVVLYTAHQCAKANQACVEWQNYVLTLGLGDGLK